MVKYILEDSGFFTNDRLNPSSRLPISFISVVNITRFRVDGYKFRFVKVNNRHTETLCRTVETRSQRYRCFLPINICIYYVILLYLLMNSYRSKVEHPHKPTFRVSNPEGLSISSSYKGTEVPRILDYTVVLFYVFRLLSTETHTSLPIFQCPLETTHNNH